MALVGSPRINQEEVEALRVYILRLVLVAQKLLLEANKMLS